MNQNEQYSKSEERFYHEDEYNRDFEYGLSRKSSYEGSENEEFSIIKKNSRVMSSGFQMVIKLGAITATVIASIVTLTTVHEHKPMDEWIVAEAATCIAYGKEERYCADCGKTVDARIIDFADHKTDEWTISIPANCTYPGEEELLCLTCGEVMDHREIGLGDHIRGDWEVSLMKTCTEDGEEITKCTVCGETLDKRVVVASHEEHIHPMVASTCTKEGLSEGMSCAVCGEILVAQKPLPLANHTRGNWQLLQAATCTVNGIEIVKCTVCQSEIDRRKVAASHKEVVDPAVAATCYQTGLTQGSHCSVCQTVIKAQQTTPITHKPITIAGVASTCTSAGVSEGQKCSICQTVLVAQNPLPLANHTKGNWQLLQAATCTVNGIEIVKCTVCQSEIDRREIAASHKEVVDPAVAATCYQTGLTEGSHCSVCQTVIKAQQTTPITHKAVKVAGVAANCAEWTTGLTEGSECELCGEVLVAQQEILPEHQEEVYIPDGWATEATCEEGVVGMGRCKVCGMETSTYIEIASALGHNYEDKVVTDDTGMTNVWRECTRCGAIE